MIDPHSVPLWTRVATSTGVQVFTGECELVRLVFPTGRATTDLVTIYNASAANVGTFGAFTHVTGGSALSPFSVEIGATFGTGIRVKAVTKAEVVAVYRGTTA